MNFATLLRILPAQFHDAIRKLKAAGFKPAAVLLLVLEYGPQLVQIVTEIIEAFRSVPAPEPVLKGHDGECCPELAKALCKTHCALIEALYANHAACVAAGCHDHDHDDETV